MKRIPIGVIDLRRSLEKIPNLISNNPKKIIVLTVIFTLIMSYFASGMSMDTTEKSFRPDTPKQRYMETVQDDFGRAAESVQIAFVAEDGDVFTEDVFLDMLGTSYRIKENRTINETLVGSKGRSSSVTTLADTVIMANQSLNIEDYVINSTGQMAAMVPGLQSQAEMYEYINSSISTCGFLLSSQDPAVKENSTRCLVSMSNIMSEPRSWAALEFYRGEFENLTKLLMNSETSSVVNHSKTIIQKMSADDFTPGADQAHFIGLLDGMNNILLSSMDQTEHQMTRSMMLSFFGLGEVMKDMQPGMGKGSSQDEDVPSLDMNETEKRERLKEMGTEGIKRTVQQVLEYNGTELDTSIQSGISDLNELNEISSQAMDKLESSNQTLSQAITILRSQGRTEQADRIEDYQNLIVDNKTRLQESKAMFSESKKMMDSAYYLSSTLEDIGESIKGLSSRDFDPNSQLSSIRATSGLGFVMMNSSVSQDKRLEAQRDLIDIAKDECENSNPRVSAGQVMMEQINESANRSLRVLLPIAFIFVVIVLSLVYRSVPETVFSLLSLGIAIIWTFGMGVLLDYTFNPMIIAVPILITGLVIDYGIHMVMRHREEREDGFDPRESTAIAVATVGGALFLTTLTTAIGFLSNSFSTMEVMKQFGILAAVGISSSFFLMVAFLPSVIQLVEKWREEKDTEEEGREMGQKQIKRKASKAITSFLSTSVDASDRHPVIVLLIVGMISLSAGYGALNVDTTFDIQDFLPEDKSQSKNIQYIADHYNVSTSYAYVLVEGGDIDSPEFLESLESSVNRMKDDEMILTDEGDVTTLLSVLRNYGTAPVGSPSHNYTLVRAFAQNDTDNDKIPDQNVGKIYDLFYEAPETKESMQQVLLQKNGSYPSSLIKIKENAVKVTSNLDNAKIMEDELEEDIVPLKESGFTTKITSGSIIGQETTSELTETQRQGLMATIVIVGVILTMVFYYEHRSKLLGILTTIPVSLVTLWIVGTMYVFDVPLNVMTVSITALTVGMGVDYSIHITHRFMEEKKIENNGLYCAMRETVHNTGAALFGSAATTVGAFAVLSTSEIMPMAQFGYITALAISYSFLVAVFVLPSILMIWAKYTQEETPKSKKKDLPILKKK